MTYSIRKALTLTALTLTVAGLSGNVFAVTKFQATHPRRAEVNARLAHQNLRINNELKEGEISHQQASYLHSEDRQIRTEERDMASQNNTHITKLEQATLNQQENAVSQQIGR
jgi:hypothetical protein